MELHNNDGSVRIKIDENEAWKKEREMLNLKLVKVKATYEYEDIPSSRS